jgi:hypothetical protein
MGYRMNGSPHKTGTIQGTSGHAAATKYMSPLKNDKEEEKTELEKLKEEADKIALENKIRKQEDIAEDYAAEDQLKTWAKDEGGRFILGEMESTDEKYDPEKKYETKKLSPKAQKKAEAHNLEIEKKAQARDKENEAYLKKQKEEEALKNQPKHQKQIKMQERLDRITARRLKKGKKGITTRQYNLQRRVNQTTDEFIKEQQENRQMWANAFKNWGRKRKGLAPIDITGHIDFDKRFKLGDAKNQLTNLDKPNISENIINVDKNKVGGGYKSSAGFLTGDTNKMGTSYNDWNSAYGETVWGGMGKRKKKKLYNQWLNSGGVQSQVIDFSNWSTDDLMKYREDNSYRP